MLSQLQIGHLDVTPQIQESISILILPAIEIQKHTPYASQVYNIHIAP